MPTFSFTGRMTAEDTIFEIDAETEAEARALAAAGKYNRATNEIATAVDWEIDPSTLRKDDGE